MKLRKGDEVIITAGKDRGKKGKIEKILVKKNSALLVGLNIYKRHLKKRDEKNPGGIIEISRPLPIANLSFVCKKCGKNTKIGYSVKNEEKLRVCRSCGVII